MHTFKIEVSLVNEALYLLKQKGVNAKVGYYPNIHVRHLAKNTSQFAELLVPEGQAKQASRILSDWEANSAPAVKQHANEFLKDIVFSIIVSIVISIGTYYYFRTPAEPTIAFLMGGPVILIIKSNIKKTG